MESQSTSPNYGADIFRVGKNTHVRHPTLPDIATLAPAFTVACTFRYLRGKVALLFSPSLMKAWNSVGVGGTIRTWLSWQLAVIEVFLLNSL